MDTEQDTPLDAPMRDTVTATIIALLPTVIGSDQPIAITPGTLLQEELDLSSSLVLEVLLGVEEAHAIQIDLEAMDDDDVATVADLARYIAGHYEQV